jgi:N12 class adenine-specific DNA methylase
MRDASAMSDSSSEDEHILIKKKSKLRQEIEDLLEQKGLVMESRISVMNLDSGEAHYFEDYAASMEFLKGKTGRWYITTPGLRYSRKDR